ncbi:hypothetical protein JIP1600_100006 [Flavobacterium psychrophilum]|nr:hypothetical protein JIP1600_100006 [Flavobacterium psychrophilum]
MLRLFYFVTLLLTKMTSSDEKIIVPVFIYFTIWVCSKF